MVEERTTNKNSICQDIVSLTPLKGATITAKNHLFIKTDIWDEAYYSHPSIVIANAIRQNGNAMNGRVYTVRTVLINKEKYHLIIRIK